MRYHSDELVEAQKVALQKTPKLVILRKLPFFKKKVDFRPVHMPNFKKIALLTNNILLKHIFGLKTTTRPL